MHRAEKQERKIQGVLHYLKEYLEARFDHASRINPTIRRVRADFLWHELACVHQVLAESKGFGPDRFVVVDIITSFDARKKEALYNPTSNNTIFNEIVTEAESEQHRSKKEQMEGYSAIRDIGAFYKAIDPSLERTILLLQTWVWWDLRDAADLCLLDMQIERAAAMRQAQMTPELLAYYRNEMHNPTADLKIEDVLAFEAQRTQELGESFAAKRKVEPGYQIIIVRDPLPNSEFDHQVQALAQHLRVLDQIAKSHALDSSLRDFYGKVFHTGADEVTCEQVQAYEKSIVASAHARLRSLAETDKTYAEPYNFKERQIQMVNEKVMRMRSALQLESAQVAAGA